MKKILDNFIERAATIEHARWAKWQRYMHSKMVPSCHEGIWEIGEEHIKRWERQINTSYDELSEKEKQSDRDQVYPYLAELKVVLALLIEEINKFESDGE